MAPPISLCVNRAQYVLCTHCIRTHKHTHTHIHTHTHCYLHYMHNHLDFAVQPRPIEFSAVPHSQRVVEGESVRLTCNFSVTQLGSNYWEPHIVWRQNGSQLSVEDSSLTLNTVELLGGYSELVLDPVQPQHAGYYECLAVDGKKKKGIEKFGEGRYVTASPRAYIDVICKQSAVATVNEHGNRRTLYHQLAPNEKLMCIYYVRS